MEKYTKAQMEIIEFENEDVITNSTDSCSCDRRSDGGWTPPVL